MVRSSPGIKLFLVLVTVMLSAVTMVPSLPIVSPEKDVLDEDSVLRVERSTSNVTRITGTGRKIRMYIKDKYLQLFADGTVNATDDDSSDYTILQRTSVNAGQVKIQGVATCTFLCMDSCGLLYSTREFSDECVFNEMLEQHYYNTYLSTKFLASKRSLYVAISKSGLPRRVEIKANATLGKLSSCTKVLPQPVEHERIEQLENKLISMMSANVTHHHLRHQQMCPTAHHMKVTMSAKCRKNKKKKKKKKGEEGGAGEEEEEIDDSVAASKSAKAGKKKEMTANRKKKAEKKLPKSGAGSKLADEDTVLTTVVPEGDPEDALVEVKN